MNPLPIHEQLAEGAEYTLAAVWNGATPRPSTTSIRQALRDAGFAPRSIPELSDWLPMATPSKGLVLWVIPESTERTVGSALVAVGKLGATHAAVWPVGSSVGKPIAGALGGWQTVWDGIVDPLPESEGPSTPRQLFGIAVFVGIAALVAVLMVKG